MKTFVRIFIFTLFVQFLSHSAANRALSRYTCGVCGVFITPNRIPKRTAQIFTLIEDKKLLSLDVMSILVSNQLRGFNDVIEDPSFWADGGFTQPIFSPSAHNTLTTFVQRDCILTGLWLAVAYGYGAYANEKISLKSVGYIVFTFCILRLLLDVSLSSFSVSSMDLMSTFKDLWYAIVIVLAFRFVYYRRFY